MSQTAQKQTEAKNQPPVTPQLKVASEKETSKKSTELPPLEDRLLKFDQLLEKRKKYDRLNNSRLRLNDFKQKKEGETITLSLSDYNNRGCEFSTKNPEVIQIVIDTLKKTIDQKILELEPQLTW